jgi:DNA-binding MarR family transcriptional regulator
MSSAQLFVLQTLSREKDLSIGELAQKTLTHQSSVSAVVSKLESKGWVSRQGSASDARKTLLSLSAQGKSILRKSTPTIQEKIVSAVRSLPKKDQGELARLLSELIEKAGLGAESAQMFFEEHS